MPSFRKPQPVPQPQLPLLRPDGTPSYEQRLALIGRHLDAQHCKAACLLEVAGNYIVRAIGVADGDLTLMEFVSEDFAADVPDAPPSPMVSRLIPLGYEVTFQAVGRLLNKRGALMIAVIECPSALQIIGYEGGHGGGQLAHVPFEISLDDWAIHDLIEA